MLLVAPAHTGSVGAVPPVMVGSGQVTVTAPQNPNLAPAGHYMLFLLNRNGVPSEGKIVRLQ